MKEEGRGKKEEGRGKKIRAIFLIFINLGEKPHAQDKISTNW
jgi:hypothetical protein